MKKFCILICTFIIIITAAGCGDTDLKSEESTENMNPSAVQRDSENNSEKESENDMANTNITPVLTYFGHATMCVVTEDNKVIYIDPYEEGDYTRTADLILVTHGHYDHNQLQKVENRNENCEIITYSEALQNGVYKTFDLPFVIVEAVEAGNNPNHDINSCVGYVLTFKNGKTLYISGDTSTTNQMSELGNRNIDYAFFCCDGVYNMGNAEAAQCAEIVGAKHNIPYHNETANGELLDKALAEDWSAPNKIILMPGETLNIE